MAASGPSGTPSRSSPSASEFMPGVPTHVSPGVAAAANVVPSPSALPALGSGSGGWLWQPSGRVSGVMAGPSAHHPRRNSARRRCQRTAPRIRPCAAARGCRESAPSEPNRSVARRGSPAAPVATEPPCHWLRGRCLSRVVYRALDSTACMRRRATRWVRPLQAHRGILPRRCAPPKVGSQGARMREALRVWGFAVLRQPGTDECVGG